MSVQGGNFIGVFRNYPDPPHFLDSLNPHNPPLPAIITSPKPDNWTKSQFIYTPPTPLSEAPQVVFFLRS